MPSESDPKMCYLDGKAKLRILYGIIYVGTNFQELVMTESTDRVAIWNSFFKLAWAEARHCYILSTKGHQPETDFDPLGGTLPPEQHHVLAALSMCNLAIEARANHLIDELVEHNVIGSDVGLAARWLPTKQKWFLLPVLAGKSVSLDSSSGPHQAIAQICDLRNDLMHVRFDELSTKLPALGTMLSYFERFVCAMEDMNVVLGRIPKARKKVISIGKFSGE